jgi:ankyrin repeat protein
MASDKITIWQAISRGDTATVEQFLSEGFDVNRRSSGEDTSLLSLAVQQDEYQMGEFLLARGANANLRDLYGWTPLMYAAVAGNVRMTELLLKHGAEIELEDYNQRGLTALALAEREGYNRITELLRRAGGK